MSFSEGMKNLFSAIAQSDAVSKAGDMFSAVKENMTDDKGLFQGGKGDPDTGEGRVFGRAQDLVEKGLDVNEKANEWLKEKGIDTDKFTGFNQTDVLGHLDLSQKRQVIQAIRAPGYSGNFQQTLKEIIGRTY
tara:strand:- start:100 stop:498 length:399 start_codon:yes stop_codon:yes gene_type:complete